MNDVHDVQQLNEDSDYMGKSLYAPLGTFTSLENEQFPGFCEVYDMHFGVHGFDCLFIWITNTVFFLVIIL